MACGRERADARLVRYGSMLPRVRNNAVNDDLALVLAKIVGRREWRCRDDCRRRASING